MRSVLLMILAGVPLGAQSLQFDFAPGKAAQGFQEVPPGTMYSEETDTTSDTLWQ